MPTLTGDPAPIEAFQEDRSVLARNARAPDSCIIYGPHPDNLADLWRGDHRASGRPLVMMIHGGFWRPEYDRTHTAPMCEAIAHAGWTVATIEYRRTPGQPDSTVADVTLAVQKLLALAAQHNGNAIVMGHSAGGHLCLYVAATQARPELVGAMALAPAADLRLVDSLHLDNDAVRDFLGEPATQRPDLDPMQLTDIPVAATIVHGKQDAIVPVSVSHAYTGRHRATRLLELDQCGHFALIDPLSDAWQTVVGELERLGRS